MRKSPNLNEIRKWFWVGLLAACILGCEASSDPNVYLKVEEVRTKLALDLPSYSTFAEVKELLQLRDDQIEVLENSQSPQGARRPQFNIFTIKLENIEIAGYRGDLALSFFNDRLESTWFYPEDFEGFANSLDLDRSALESRQGVMKKPFTRMWIYTDFQQKPYIGWEDVRLSQQKMDWIDRYA